MASKQKSHPKKTRPVSKILLFPTVSRAVVLASASTSVFSLPEFAPCTGMGSLREVNDFSYDVDDKSLAREAEDAENAEAEMTVFTKSVIRVVRVQADALKLKQNIDYPDVLVGVRRTSFALVANSESYDLVDLHNIRKIPLFPISQDVSSEGEEEPGPKVPPIIAPVAEDEFLVTSGTRPEDPAMGLVVNVDGDISRGTIAWPKYPTSVAVDFPNIAAVIDTSVMLYSLHDQALIQETKYSSVPLVTNVLTPYSTPYEPLADRIRLSPLVSQLSQEESEDRIKRETEIAQKLSIISSSLFVFSQDQGVECLLSSPRMLKLEQLVWKGKLEEVTNEIETWNISTELAVTEMEYLQLLVGLGYLLHSDFGNAAQSWLEGAGATLDPRSVIYMFGDKQDIRGEVWLFNGATQLVEKILSKKKSRDAKGFYQYFLREWLQKRELESVGGDKKQVFQSLELAYLRLLINSDTAKKEDIYATIDHDVVESYDDAVDMLMTNKRYFLLTRLYQKHGHTKDVLDCWRKMLTKEWDDSEFVHGEEKMAAYLIQCQDKDLVWEYGLWLVSHSPRNGLKVFTNSNAACQFDDHELLTELKQHDEAWRSYLKYLVYEKKSNLFTSDLIAFLTDDLIQKVEKKATRKHLEKTNSEYKALKLPKTRFLDYLTGLKLRGIEEGFIQLRLELIELLEANTDYDATKLIELITPYSENLLMEAAILYGRLGVHEKTLNILCHSLGDYDTALDYCQAGNATGLVRDQQDEPDPQIQRDLFKALFLEFLKLQDEETKIQVTQKLLNQWGTKLDVQLVLKMTPDKWPVEILSDYLSQVFRRILNNKNQSTLHRSLARSHHLAISRTLQDLKDPNPH
ncbi:hypothetical protein TRICI_003055 [Trichomonascus ciferrii]|uniref:CNH domain-containing protein n=1 Tax=Trichomonascus ciferrii TaxID=44093 RepID=A0A642V4Y8_9ASCO|nr:hypothetical protein TRICI_003055 [Trichomonascus ciferrii]